FDVASQEQRQDLGSVDTLPVRFCEIAGSVNVDDTGDMAGLTEVLPFSLEHRHAGRDPQKLRQMSSGRAAGRADPIRIDAVVLRVRSHPANGSLGVVDRRGELI